MVVPKDTWTQDILRVRTGEKKPADKKTNEPAKERETQKEPAKEAAEVTKRE